MNEATSEEWEDMSETQRSEIKARLMAACDTQVDVAATVLRERLINGSRTALADHLARHSL